MSDHPTGDQPRDNAPDTADEPRDNAPDHPGEQAKQRERRDSAPTEDVSDQHNDRADEESEPDEAEADTSERPAGP